MLGDEPLLRAMPTIEQVLVRGDDGPVCAVEVSYEGSCQLEEDLLDEPDGFDAALAPLGRAVASTLVRVADLPFAFRPADQSS